MAFSCLYDQAHGCETRQLGSMVAKFVMFLQNFVTHDPQRASSMLQQYVKLLRYGYLLAFPLPVKQVCTNLKSGGCRVWSYCEW